VLFGGRASFLGREAPALRPLRGFGWPTTRTVGRKSSADQFRQFPEGDLAIAKLGSLFRRGDGEHPGNEPTTQTLEESVSLLTGEDR
jgi:hypothetical protein